MIGDSETARDIVQNAFVKIWTSRHGYRLNGSPGREDAPARLNGSPGREDAPARLNGSVDAYLITVVRNACIDHLRSTSHDREVALDDLAADIRCEPAVDTDLRDALEAALRKLPDTQREVFVLSEYEGLTYQEIAGVLRCPAGTVASRKSAAMESLRKLLRPWMEGDTE
jgi:DNA-directed RNA polymerase specialized sigma24 family protein